MSAGPPLPTDLWDRLPPEARALILALRAELAELRAKVREQQAQLHELRERLNQNSTNSSRPPSSDPPAVKRAPPKPPSGRRSGGQPGHALHQRPLLEPTRPAIALKPSACRQCGHALMGADPQPLRHQVLELPAARPDVTEYHLHRLRCADCGRTTCAALPPGVPTGGQGPRLQAAVALLTGAYRLSKRQVEGLCADLRRDFQAMVDRGNAGSALGEELLLFAEDVFTQWYRVRDGTIRRPTLRHYVDSQRPWFREQLEAGLGCGCARTAAVCADLL